jgi:hypothetical protein
MRNRGWDGGNVALRACWLIIAGAARAMRNADLVSALEGVARDCGYGEHSDDPGGAAMRPMRMCLPMALWPGQQVRARV